MTIKRCDDLTILLKLIILIIIMLIILIMQIIRGAFEWHGIADSHIDSVIQTLYH